MKTLIVIVNYRTPDLTLDCLASLREEVAELDHIAVTVVDGGSADGSAEKIAEEIDRRGWGDWVDFMPIKHNGGFGYANNAAIRPALEADRPPDYALLLNPDTIVRAGAVRNLLDFIHDRPRVGVVGSRLENPDGTVQVSAFRFPTALGEFVRMLRLGLVSRALHPWVHAPPAREEPHEAEWLSGASLLIRREVFEAIGLLDEGYFLYFDEVDFCLRAHRAGWACWYVPHSRVVHLVGQSTGFTVTPEKAKRRPAYWFESRRRYFLKNHGPIRTLLADLAWLTGHALWRVRRRIQRKPDLDPPRFLSDFFHQSVLRRGFRL